MIEKKVSYTGQKQVDTLNSGIRIEEGKGRLVISESGTEMLVASKDGFVLNDGTDFRLILGKFPDGTIGLIISKPGEDVYSLFS